MLGWQKSTKLSGNWKSRERKWEQECFYRWTILIGSASNKNTDAKCSEDTILARVD